MNLLNKLMESKSRASCTSAIAIISIIFVFTNGEVAAKDFAEFPIPHLKRRIFLEKRKATLATPLDVSKLCKLWFENDQNNIQILLNSFLSSKISDSQWITTCKLLRQNDLSREVHYENSRQIDSEILRLKSMKDNINPEFYLIRSIGRRKNVTTRTEELHNSPSDNYNYLTMNKINNRIRRKKREFKDIPPSRYSSLPSLQVPRYYPAEDIPPSRYSGLPSLQVPRYYPYVMAEMIPGGVKIRHPSIIAANGCPAYFIADRSGRCRQVFQYSLKFGSKSRFRSSPNSYEVRQEYPYLRHPIITPKLRGRDSSSDKSPSESVSRSSSKSKLISVLRKAVDWLDKSSRSNTGENASSSKENSNDEAVELRSRILSILRNRKTRRLPQSRPKFSSESKDNASSPTNDDTGSDCKTSTVEYDD